MIKRFAIILMLAGLIFGGLFAFKLYRMQEAIKGVRLPPPAIVAVTEVEQVEWHSSLAAVGSLVAVSGVAVTNEIGGIVKTIYFESGQSVKKGQVLIELDSTTDQAELSGLLAERRLAQIQFERSRKLIAKKFISKADYDRNQALLDAADAVVKTKKTVIEKKRVRAPFSGTLGIRTVDVGQYLSPGSAIVTLQQLNPIYLDFKLPERYLGRLTQGQSIKINVQAYPDKVFDGQISAMSPLMDQNTRSVQIRATLPNPEQLLRPGMFAKIEVLSDQPRILLALPDTAISYNPYGDFVFVVEQGEQGLVVQSRQVKTGATQDGQVEIIEGLRQGERIVSAGQIKLRNGMAVILDDKLAPGERSKGPVL